MIILPDTYYLSVGLFAVLVIYGTLRLQAAWAMPYNAVLCTVAAWYFIEPLYLEEIFAYFKPQHLQSAYDAVLIFYICFAAATPMLVQQLRQKLNASRLSQAYVPAETVLLVVSVLWLALLAYGTVRLQGDLLGALFPIGGRSSARMWSRAAGSGAGPEGFIVSTASYVYTLSLAAFGLLLFLLPRGGYRALALVLIVVSWPYAFLQGSRNVAIAVVLPAVISYVLLSRQSVLAKAIGVGAVLAALELAFRFIIFYRNIGFGEAQLDDVQSTQHLGLNMASELAFCIQYVSEGTLDLSYGGRYLAELANVIPRAIWPEKPLIGIDYALVRGFASNDVDIGVFATISSGLIGQGVLNFGPILGPIAGALLMSVWVGLLARFREQGTPLRLALFLVGLGLTFNLGRDITLLVLWPMIFAYLGVRVIEWRSRRQGIARRLVPHGSALLTSAQPTSFHRH